MATKKTNKKCEKQTKVICSSCGAEIVIPEHEHTVKGVAVGKDSGLGTVILPTENNGKAALDKLRELATSDKAMRKLVDEIVERIYTGGYIDVENIVRRWIPSQCLAMAHNNVGFHQSLLFRGYDYSWKVLINDLRCQARLAYKHDDEGVADRNRWYNKSVALSMAQHFISSLSDEMNIRKLDHRYCHHHGNREYIKLRCWLNNGKGVHVNEFPKVFTPLEKAKAKIASSQAPKTLLDAVEAFDKLRRSVKYTPENPSSSFLNAYKAAGAYYTIKDLILFEGCKMKVDADGNTDNREWLHGGKKRKFVEKEQSLEALEKKAAEVVSSGVDMDGYQMLGLLNDFLAYNDFDYCKTYEKWADQSAARRAIRKANQHRRSR